MTRKYRLERTAFIGCRNTAYMDVDDAEPCPFCGSRQVTIYPYGQGTTSYVEGVPTLYLSSATCKCRGPPRRFRRLQARAAFYGPVVNRARRIRFRRGQIVHG